MHSVIQEIVRSTEERVRQIEHPQEHRQLPFKKRDIAEIIGRKKAEGKVAVIAEVKPSSPRRKLRDILPADAAIIARQMEDAGAVAISVLTEPHFFKGSLENLSAVRKEVALPILRKDFIISGKQIDEVEADMILLIVSVLGESAGELVRLVQSRGIEPLVEVHNEEELDIALSTNARLIGINNRDLKTLETDLEVTLRLAPVVRKYDKENGTRHIVISESGIGDASDVRRVIAAGADGILVGTSIIESGDIYARTKELVEALDLYSFRDGDTTEVLK
ncbi:indole-3-glycerol-phosphate synthase [Methanolobus chelungpuianus]|uniref:Indole-3-glycerol phosphate synthase n=1 Tax=Methanolobus chelungpuianus TaxID=502115 RepID=A0AAE3HC36_9EURY|nr:indole-3-glycerol-phosphate synthase [Methanolobus chelungpuianus]MCQ6963374.1 indole-3-glycerol phosphate synthase [Methanolobus chelungpuianus]